MFTSDNGPHKEGNRLLSLLPRDAYTEITARCETVPLAFKAVLFEPNTPIESVWFPLSGCLSMVAIMDRGQKVEVGTIGFEGMASISLILGVDTVPCQCIVQVAGMALCMSRADFEEQLEAVPEFASVLHRYTQAWADQIGRSAACNAIHTVDERCARWLLMTQDRVSSNVIPLTQEFLAIMLGVRRGSVTLAASSLQRAGLIDYKRGKITVLDRKGLEDASCDCYKVIQSSYEQRLGKLTASTSLTS
jgi:CRP-like cAMP-binding protein